MTQYHSLAFILFLLQGNVYARHNAVTTERSSTDLTLSTASYRISKYRDLNQDSFIVEVKHGKTHIAPPATLRLILQKYHKPAMSNIHRRMDVNPTP